MRERCRAMYRYFSYPEKGFCYLIWAIVGAWVIMGLGITYNLWYWEMDMSKQRVAMERHIELLEEYIGRHVGEIFD